MDELRAEAMRGGAVVCDTPGIHTVYTHSLAYVRIDARSKSHANIRMPPSNQRRKYTHTLTCRRDVRLPRPPLYAVER